MAAPPLARAGGGRAGAAHPLVLLKAAPWARGATDGVCLHRRPRRAAERRRWGPVMAWKLSMRRVATAGELQGKSFLAGDRTAREERQPPGRSQFEPTRRTRVGLRRLRRP